MARTIYITDAAAPLGRACAVRLGRAGWNIVMGASSVASLKSVCDELPDNATLPRRAVPTDLGNILPLLEEGEARFGSIDAVLLNYRPRGGSKRRAVDGQVHAVAVVGEAARPFLRQSEGHFVVAGRRGGPRSLSGAMQTVARNAVRTLSDALAQDWADEPIQISLVEPDGLDGPKPMARRVARILNGAPPRRPVVGQRRAYA
ncbi:MAG: hypothetical protein AAF311_02625 [Pseudomonadota bacterium]